MILKILTKILYKNNVYSNHTHHGNLYASQNDCVNVGWVHQATKFFLEPTHARRHESICFLNIEVGGRTFVIS